MSIFNREKSIVIASIVMENSRNILAGITNSGSSLRCRCRQIDFRTIRGAVLGDYYVGSAALDLEPPNSGFALVAA
jgi:hypothetical protein